MTSYSVIDRQVLVLSHFTGNLSVARIREIQRYKSGRVEVLKAKRGKTQ